jgi:hypothetical protein
MESTDLPRSGPREARPPLEAAAGELRTLKARIRRPSKARKVALPDPDEFVKLMDRVRKKKR